MFHGHNNERNIVGAYCLLVNKLMKLYVELLSQIQSPTNQALTESIMSDFEQSMIGGIV